MVGTDRWKGAAVGDRQKGFWPDWEVETRPKAWAWPWKPGGRSVLLRKEQDDAV